MNFSNRFYPDSHIEIINASVEYGKIQHAIFDFDGTISLIREGWQSVMIPMMVEILMGTPNHESDKEIQATVTEFVDRLTGKQTIYQMIHLSKEIEKRGGNPSDPIVYKQIYHDRLMNHIQNRIDNLRIKTIQPPDMMVPGALDILKSMQVRGVTCYLASGTDEIYVLEEAHMLGIPKYFKGIYGALDNYKAFSKKMVIDRIIKENQLDGNELVALGDGYVEIEDSKSVGGIAIGVACNEATRQGVDEWKRSRLISAGADVIIPDFREHQKLIKLLFAEN
jgi:phosphoglycolate phosphatase-like HAD superfamily hydrolase